MSTYREKQEQLQLSFWPIIETVKDNNIVAMISNEPRRHFKNQQNASTIYRDDILTGDENLDWINNVSISEINR